MVSNIISCLWEGQPLDIIKLNLRFIHFSLTKTAGIELFTIGIGNNINVNELKTIASDPLFYQYVKDYGQLASIQFKLARNLCQGRLTNGTSKYDITSS